MRKKTKDFESGLFVLFTINRAKEIFGRNSLSTIWQLITPPLTCNWQPLLKVITFWETFDTWNYNLFMASFELSDTKRYNLYMYDNWSDKSLQSDFYLAGLAIKGIEAHFSLTRMETFIKRRSRNQMISEYHTEYHIISKLIFLRIIIPKFMNIGQLLHVKDICKIVKNQHV